MSVSKPLHVLANSFAKRKLQESVNFWNSVKSDVKIVLGRKIENQQSKKKQKKKQDGYQNLFWNSIYREFMNYIPSIKISGLKHFSLLRDAKNFRVVFHKKKKFPAKILIFIIGKISISVSFRIPKKALEKQNLFSRVPQTFSDFSFRIYFGFLIFSGVEK